MSIESKPNRFAARGIGLAAGVVCRRVLPADPRRSNIATMTEIGAVAGCN
jgi:hypothetical protein